MAKENLKAAMKNESCVSLDHNAVAKRAYEIYLSRKGKPGSATEDWINAEKELRALASKPNKSKPIETPATKSNRRDNGRNASAR